MAIIIPSKNIYENQNQKVIDNYIDKIEVNATEVVPSNEYETPVYNESFNKFIDGEGKSDSSEALSTPLNGYYTLYTVYSELKLTYCDFSVLIKKLQNNKFISNLLLGAKTDINGNETSNINYTIYGKKRNGTIKVGYNIDLSAIPNKIKGFYTVAATPTITKEEQLSISSNYETEEIKSLFSTTLKTQHPDITYAGDEDPTATVTVINEGTNLKTVTAINYKENNIDYYKLLSGNGSGTLKVLVGIEKISAWGDGKIKVSNPSESNDYIELKSNYTQYLPEKIEITVYGNKIGIDLNEKTLTYQLEGVENATSPFSIENNELLQTTNYYSNEGNLALDKQNNHTLTIYQEGKETATLRCDISKYYDENGKIAINPDQINLLNADEYIGIGNAKYSLGVVSQIKEDTFNGSPFNGGDFYLQGYKNGAYVKDLNNITISKNEGEEIGRINLSFKKTEEFDSIRFKRNGKSIDTDILYKIDTLENGKTYTFSVTLGTFSKLINWKDMQIVKGEKEQPFKEWKPMTFQIYDKVIPMVVKSDLIDLVSREKNNIGNIKFLETKYYLGINDYGQINENSTVNANVLANSVIVETKEEGYGIGFPIKVSPKEKLFISFDVDGNGTFSTIFLDDLGNVIPSVISDDEKEIEIPNISVIKWAVIILKSVVGKTAIYKNFSVNSNILHEFPMSYYENGNPKQFQVLSNNIVFDGAIFQNINIQEIYSSETEISNTT